MTALPTKADFRGVANQGEMKVQLDQLRDYLAGLFGDGGNSIEKTLSISDGVIEVVTDDPIAALRDSSATGNDPKNVTANFRVTTPNNTNVVDFGAGSGDAIVRTYDPAGRFIVRTGANVPRFYMDNGGKLGVNTPPDFQLHVRRVNPSVGHLSTDAVTAILEDTDGVGLSLGTSNDALAAIYFADAQASQAGRIGYDHADDQMDFRVGNTTNAMLDQYGNWFLAGNTDTNPASSGVNGVCLTGQFNQINVGNGGTAANFGRNGSTGSVVQIRDDGSVVGSISTDGTNASFNTSSDYRLKSNYTPIAGAVDKVKAAPAYLGDITVGGTTNTQRHYFIAHELQAAVPDAVSGEKDAVDQDTGEPIYQQVDAQRLVPVLWAAVQDLDSRLASLESA